MKILLNIGSINAFKSLNHYSSLSLSRRIAMLGSFL